MIRPKSVSTFGVEYEIVWSRRRPRWAPRDATYGALCWSAHKIWVCTACTEREQRDTLIHELFHLWFEQVHIRDYIPDLDESREDDLVKLMTNAAMEVFEHNPSVTKMFLR